jgi:hypothetical protein
MVGLKFSSFENFSDLIIFVDRLDEPGVDFSYIVNCHVDLSV